MRCQLTRERLIISACAFLGMVTGLIILIPGIILYTDSAPHLGFFFNPRLCPVVDDHSKWTAFDDCALLQGMDVNDALQDIPMYSKLLFTGYPYQVSVFLPVGVKARFALALILDGKAAVASTELNSENLAIEAAAASEKRDSSEPRSETETREEVPIGEVKVKYSDIEGGEPVRVWRSGFFSELDGDFGDTSTCNRQDQAGCQYTPLRSMKKYVIPLRDFTFERSSPFPANQTYLRLTDVVINDPHGPRGLTPEFWIEIDGNESQIQFIGMILIWIGGLLLDCSPGLAYYFLTRIKSVSRVRQS